MTDDDRLPRVGSEVQIVTAVTDARGVLVAVVETEDDVASITASLPRGGEANRVPFVRSGSAPVVATAYHAILVIEGGEVRYQSRLAHGILTASDGRPVVSAVYPISVNGIVSSVGVEIQGTDILWCEDVILRLSTDLREGRFDLLHQWMAEFGLEVPEQDAGSEDEGPDEDAGDA